MTKLRKALLSAVLAFGAMVLLAPRPAPSSSPSLRLRLPSSTPPRVLQIFDRSCADCHSEQTRWPWYSSVPPISWIVAKHVRNGRQFLNFSRFDGRALRDAQDLLHAVAREVKARSMPLASYTFIHRDARLTGTDAGDLIRWAEQERGRPRSPFPTPTDVASLVALESLERRLAARGRPPAMCHSAR